jgi:hyperosmotically inducible protein
VNSLIRTGLVMTALAVSAMATDRVARAADPDTGSTTDATPKVKHKKKAAHDARTEAEPGADNTGVNKRDRKESEPTADQQKNDKTDLDLTAQIRRSIVKDKDLSTNAHNVKIIAQDGKVTLKGPVASSSEKKVVEQKASAVAGAANVTSEIEIKQ